MSSRTAAEVTPDAHLPYLDGVRAMAAFWVFLAHVGIWGGSDWLPSPKIAVQIFMMHSGYLMVHHARLRPSSARDFWTRRFFRVTPGYWLALALAFGLGSWFVAGYGSLRDLRPGYWTGDLYDPTQIRYTALNFLLHATYLFGLSKAYASSTLLPDWSISLEMQFYAVFPALDRVLRHRLGPWIFAAMAYGSITYFSWARHAGLKSIWPDPSFLPVALWYFLIGMLIAHGVAARRREYLTLGLALSAVAWYKYGDYLVPLVALYFAAIGWVDCGSSLRSLANRVLGNRLMQWGARVSYGVFLLHGFVLSLLGGWLARQPWITTLEPGTRVLVMSCLLTPIVLVAAQLLYSRVERPGIELGKRLLQRDSAQPTPRSEREKRRLKRAA